MRRISYWPFSCLQFDFPHRQPSLPGPKRTLHGLPPPLITFCVSSLDPPGWNSVYRLSGPRDVRRLTDIACFLPLVDSKWTPLLSPLSNKQVSRGRRFLKSDKPQCSTGSGRTEPCQTRRRRRRRRRLACLFSSTWFLWPDSTILITAT